MFRKIVLPLFIVFAFTGASAAQQCETVIALSRTVATSLSDEASVKQQASDFCKEYSRSSGKSGSVSASGAYGALAASFSSSKASSEQVFDKYCSASSDNQARQDVYKQYVESIAPDAYGAYEQCLRLSGRDLRFNVDVGSVLPTEFSMTVAFASQLQASRSATLAVATSDGINCDWFGYSDSKEVELATGRTAILTCERDQYGNKGYVRIVRTDASGVDQLTVPWQAYNDEGMPVDTLRSLTQTLADLQNELANTASEVSTQKSIMSSLSDRPSITVYQCPAGTQGWNPGGEWGSYGCQGQLSATPTCQNIEFPNYQTLDCTPIGALKLY